MDPLLVNLDDVAQGLLAILSHGGGLLCGWLDLDNPTSPHEPPPSQNVRKKRYVIPPLARNATQSRTRTAAPEGPRHKHRGRCCSPWKGPAIPCGLRLAHNACGAAERYRTFHLAH